MTSEQNSCISTSDGETKDLEALLGAFSSMRTLEEIAYAYSKAGHDVIKAGDLLYQIHESNNHSASNKENGEIGHLKFEEPCHEKQLKIPKPWKMSASLGTVSGVLGNKYARLSSSGNVSNASRDTVRPKKIELTESLLDRNDSEPVVSNYTPSNHDIEEFLFLMLGEGFKLSKNMIQDVLGQCGYNMKQSMDELLKLSTETLDKNNAACTGSLDGANDSSSIMNTYKEHSSNLASMRRKSSMDKSNLANEVLQSLFNVPEKSEEGESKKCLPIGFNRTRVVGQRAITKPLDSHVSSSKWIPRKEDIKNDEEDEYHVLRSAAKQHWEAMKTYYEAAISAFTRGDNEKANYFLEEGRYYNLKAREADAKSNAQIVEPRKKNDEICLDLQGQTAKEALNLLELHLHSLANISSFRCLKVIIGADGEDRKQGKKRRLVIKLLEKESINWFEDANDLGVLNIQLDQIDRTKLSFAKDWGN